MNYLEIRTDVLVVIKGSFLLSFLPPIGTTSVTHKAGDNSGVAHSRSA